MRIEELRFERYGHFTDRSLVFRNDARLHIVLGANEAGKTSALSAIGDLLFGFSKRTDYDFLHESKALRLGARLRLDDGATLAFRRRKGDKNTLLDEFDKPLPDDVLAPLLGAATRESFFVEYGLTARALRDGGQELLKAGGRLAETLAASSAQLAALSRLRARLDEEADALFGARKAGTKAFYVAAARFDDADRHLREATVTDDALKAAEESLVEAQAAYEALRGDHERIGRDLAIRARAARTRLNLAQLDAHRAELARVADLPAVSAEEVARLRAAFDDGERLAAALAAAAAEDAADQAAIAALAVDEALLARDAEIQALRERLGAVRKAQSDLPRREGERRIAQEALTESARRLGLASFEALLTHLPSDPALAGAREIIDARRRAEERVKEASAQVEEARRQLREVEQDEGGGEHAADPEPFLRRFDAYSDIPGDADHLRRERAAHALEAKRLAEDAARLDPHPGALDELACRPLPERAEIEAARSLDAELADKEKRAFADIAAARGKLAEIEGEIERYSRGGGAATLQDLATARAARDAASAALGAHLDGEPQERRAAFGVLRDATRDIDATTDVLLQDADRATRLASARERLAGEQAQLKTLLDSEAALQERRAAATDAWQELWRASGFAPRAPAAMAQWLDRALDLLERRRRLEESRSVAAALEDKLAANSDALARLVTDLGGFVDSDTPIEALHKDAQARLSRLNKIWTQARERAVRRSHAEEDVARREATLAHSLKALEEARAHWPERMGAIGLGGEASVAQSEAALGVWRDVPMQRKEFEDQSRRIQRIEQDMADFAADVALLVDSAGPALAGQAPLAALEALAARLEAARGASARRDALREAVEKRAAARKALETTRAQAQGALDKGREALRLASAAAMGEPIAKLERRAALMQMIDDIARHFVQIGDGLDEAALRAEQAGLDPDLLSGEIERLTIEQAQLRDDIEQAVTARHEAEKRRDRLTAGNHAERAAQDRADAGADVLRVADRWLTRAAAARLAAQAIERHRAAVQDPLILRASALFSLATAGAFSGLCVDYDDSDAPTLAGRRPDDARTPVAGMSEGARDQLYLALRLALLELRRAEPLPFIGDDLLASFDEKRVACALTLLAEFGRGRQAIVFTHHRHVADIARETLGDAADVTIL